jgi:L-rhamnose mutarotase
VMNGRFACSQQTSRLQLAKLIWIQFERRGARTHLEHAMNRVGFQFKVRQDRLAEYKEHHKHVWPEMLDALRETGWHNYSLFMRADGLIFGYFETEESLAVAQAKMAGKEVNTRWQEFMSDFMDANARPDETFVELEEYFHLD